MRLISLVLVAVVTLVATSATPIGTEKQIQSTDEHPVNLRSVEERKGGRGGGRSRSWSHSRSRGHGKSGGGYYVPSHGFFHHEEEDKRHKSKFDKFLDEWF
uniref:Uncharacterized protein n=1 Tax=Peronospora matthiolae TaxID=2874970 RepID=A0AAV1VKZ0_9STRA